MCAARAIVCVGTNVISAWRSGVEEGRRLYISCVEFLSFLTELSSAFWNRVFMRTLGMLGPGLAI